MYTGPYTGSRLLSQQGGGTTENVGTDLDSPLPHSRHVGFLLQIKCGVILENHRVRATEGIKLY